MDSRRELVLSSATVRAMAAGVGERCSMSVKESVPNQSETPQERLERILIESNSRPVEDLREIDDLWPEDFDPDGFLEFVLRGRQERRSRRQDP